MNNDSQHFDEAQLTAYALNELDAAGRAEVEAWLAAHPDARRWVEEARQTASRLQTELSAEECPALTAQQSRAIQRQLHAERPGWRGRSWLPSFRFIEIMTAIAMIAVLAALLLPSLAKSKSRSIRQVAAVAKPDAVVVAVQPSADQVTPPATATVAAAPESKPVETKPADTTGTLAINTPVQPLSPPAPQTAAVPSTDFNSHTTVTQGRMADAEKQLAMNNGAEVRVVNALTGAGDLRNMENSGGGGGGGGGGNANRRTQMRAAPVQTIITDFSFQQGQAAGQGSLSISQPSQDAIRSPAPSTPALGNQLASGQTFNPNPNNGAMIGQINSGNNNVGGGTRYVTTINPPAELPRQFGGSPRSRDRDAWQQGYMAGQQNRWAAPPAGYSTEAYSSITDNPFLPARENPLSTFGVDVDTASYANLRRFLTMNQLPPPDAVRIEEMVNYFSYNYPPPKDGAPFSLNVEVAGCPWREGHRLVRVGLKGREIARAQRPPSNLVFLIDVSGSMGEPNKLPLLKESLKLLARQLTENDHVAIVTYAGSAGLALPQTSGSDKATILRALDSLEAGGSTYGSAGIQMAYQVARENYIEGGVNRVILCTDGDFNVGVTSPGDLTRLIEEAAQSKVFLSVLGFGMGNYKDATMELLAKKGHGNYAYIDSLNEGRRVLVEQMSGTLVTIAKDVKVQIEFNPAAVQSYRLIGYENRLLAKEDFNNDQKAAGDIGAGHTVTALYEIVPAGMEADATPGVDPLKYQKPAKPAAPAVRSDELLTLKLRYKQPEGDTSRLLTSVVKDSDKSFTRASVDFRFAAAVAELGMLLRHSPYAGSATFNTAWTHAQAALGKDPDGYRAEFLTLIETARRLAGQGE